MTDTILKNMGRNSFTRVDGGLVDISILKKRSKKTGDRYVTLRLTEAQVFSPLPFLAKWSTSTASEVGLSLNSGKVKLEVAEHEDFYMIYLKYPRQAYTVTLHEERTIEKVVHPPGPYTFPAGPGRISLPRALFGMEQIPFTSPFYRSDWQATFDYTTNWSQEQFSLIEETLPNVPAASAAAKNRQAYQGYYKAVDLFGYGSPEVETELARLEELS